MDVKLGTLDHQYTAVEGWGALPPEIVIGDVAGICVDSRDQILVFNRGEHPVIVFEPDGSFVTTWGEGSFVKPHGIDVGNDGTIYCTDDGAHVVRAFTPDGVEKMVLGTPGRSPGFMSGDPFCACTHTAISPSGEMYVSDGYGNARIHKYSLEGKLLFSWGSSGIEPGSFNIPHNIVCDDRGLVYVADRENHRIQVFNGDGDLEAIWRDVHRPSALALMKHGADVLLVVGELGPRHYYPSQTGAPNLGPRISIWATSGERIAHLEASPAAGLEPGQFISPHGIGVDSAGSLYVGEVVSAAWPIVMPREDMPANARRLQKLQRG
jgi:DNA-binding beta-propeller fold protein YncE